MHNYGQESEKFVKFQVFKLFDKLNKYKGITLPCVPFFFLFYRRQFAFTAQEN